MDEMQESAQMRISSILSSGLEGEAKTNKDYFKDLADIISGNNLCEEEETNNGRTKKNLG